MTVSEFTPVWSWQIANVLTVQRKLGCKQTNKQADRQTNQPKNKQTQLLGRSWGGLCREFGRNNSRREREETWILCGSVDLAGVKAVRRRLIPARLKLWANQA